MRDILKEQRKNQKMTQAEIANKAGISRSEYTNIEIGIREPSFALALKLKKILGYRDDNLFKNTEQHLALNLSVIELIEGEISMAEKKSAQTAGTVMSAQDNIINLYGNTAGTILQALNKNEAMGLFAAESILIGENDGIPKDNVIKLFGEKAANFVTNAGKLGIHYNCYGNCNDNLMYFTFRGFEMAVTFSNIEKVSKMKDKA